ncbi:MAG: hypothetical protein ACLFTA_01105 [Candidatus Nanohaloarchaea archaeon]
MKDLWSIVAYPAASIAGYFIALGAAEQIASAVGLEEWAATVGILAVTGLVVGFLVDEVIPTYIHEKRAGSGVGGGDLDGGGDFDFE